MALPADILKTTVTFGKSYDAMGDNATVTVKLTPSHRLLWEATGDYISPFEAVSVADSGVVGSFTVARDQPGFRNQDGDEIRGWFYTATVTETRGKQSLLYRKVFTPTIDQALIDLDALPIDGIVQPPGSAPVPAVTSVNGQSGAVVVEGASDTNVAGLVADDESLTGQALRDKFVPVGSVASGATWGSSSVSGSGEDNGEVDRGSQPDEGDGEPLSPPPAGEHGE